MTVGLTFLGSTAHTPPGRSPPTLDPGDTSPALSLDCVGCFWKHWVYSTPMFCRSHPSSGSPGPPRCLPLWAYPHPSWGWPKTAKQKSGGFEHVKCFSGVKGFGYSLKDTKLKSPQQACMLCVWKGKGTKASCPWLGIQWGNWTFLLEHFKGTKLGACRQSPLVPLWSIRPATDLWR